MTTKQKHLWDYDHDYYCSDTNFYSNDCSIEFESFADFFENWGDSDMNYNLLFRWDWENHERINKENDDDDLKTDTLKIYWMLQRKGIFMACEMPITRDQEDAVKAFLEPRWKHLKKLWKPL